MSFDSFEPVDQNYVNLSRIHRALHLRNLLALHGFDTKVYRATNYINGYEEVFPEAETIYSEEEDSDVHIDESVDPTIICRILVDKGLEGLLLDNDVISLTDKVQHQFEITTNVDLKEEDGLVVTSPDGRTIKLRVIECQAHHFKSTEGSKYNTVVI